MKQQKPWELSRVVGLLLGIMMVVDVLLMLMLPQLVQWATTQRPGDKLYGDYLIILYSAGVMAELVMWQCGRILHNVNAGQPFCKDTVRRLRVVGGECLFLAALLLFYILFLRVVKFFMALLLVVFGFIGLMLFVFATLFRQAGEYKNEHDHTV